MEQFNKDGGIKMPDIHDMMDEVYSDVLTELYQARLEKYQRERLNKGLKITTYKDKVKK